MQPVVQLLLLCRLQNNFVAFLSPILQGVVVVPSCLEYKYTSDRSSGSYLWDSGTLFAEKRIQRLQDQYSSVHGIFSFSTTI